MMIRKSIVSLMTGFQILSRTYFLINFNQHTTTQCTGLVILSLLLKNMLQSEFFNHHSLTPVKNINTSSTTKSFTIESLLGLATGSNDSSNATNNSYHSDDNILKYYDKNQPFTYKYNPSSILYDMALSYNCSQKTDTKQSHRLIDSNSKKRALESNSNGHGLVSKNKRVRTIFTPDQLERLEAEFERQQYMVGPERLYLAHTLHLTEAQVKVWFQNRRIKWRKHHLEVNQQRLALLKQQCTDF